MNTWTSRSLPLVVVLFCGAALRAQGPVETIGQFDLRAAPVSASLISGGGSIWDWLNVQNTFTTVDMAFSGVGVAKDGFANADQGTTVEVVFAPGALVNGAGDDLVMFDARFSINEYTLSTSFDGFVAQAALPTGAFAATGVIELYYYVGGGPYAAEVFGATLDLTTLGVPTGASVDRVRFTTTTTECDPLGLGALCGPGCGFVSSYCTAGTTQNGCNASISGTGSASASFASAFVISVANVEGQRSGMVFYGITGTLALPWGLGSSSWLCVKPPIQRTAIQQTGGALNGCNGALALDWNAFHASAPGSLGQPFQAGDLVFAQGWFRDPGAVKSTSLSDALMFSLVP